MNNVELQKKVWNNLKGSAAKAKKFEDLVAVSFSLTGEANEDLYVVVRGGNIEVEPYHYNDCGCHAEASAETIDKMFSGELAFDKALSDGLVCIKKGDPAKLKALECLVPSKKKAAKSKDEKPAAKTAAKAEKPAAKEKAKAEAPKAKAEVKPEPKAEVKPAPAAVKAPAPAASSAKAAAPAAKPAVAPAAATKPADKKPCKKCKK